MLRLFVNGAQVSQLAGRRLARDLGLAAADRRQRRLGRVVQRHDRRGAGLQPRAHRRRDPERHGRAASRPTRSRRRSSRGRRRRAPRGSTPARRRRRASTSRWARGSITASTFELKDAANAIVPATVTYDARHEHGDADAAERAHLRRDLHRHRQGRRRRRQRPRRQPARGRLRRGRSRSRRRRRRSSSSARPATASARTSARSSRNEGLNAFTTIDVAFLSPALLAQFDVVILGETPLSPAQVTSLTGWVNGGGNLIAMRPDKQLAGLLGLTDAGTTLANAYLQVATASGPGAGIVGSTMQFHGVADRYTLNGATSVATLYSTATTATSNPAVTLRSRRRERRPGGRLHVRPRALRRLHPAGEPGLGDARSGTASSASARTTSSTAPAPATSSRTGSTRTRSRSRRRTSSSGCCST